jgi:hypothetical protein
MLFLRSYHYSMFSLYVPIYAVLIYRHAGHPSGKEHHKGES